MYSRRTKRLAAGLGVSAGLMLAAASAGLGLRVRVLEGSDLHRRIQGAAAASVADQDAGNDVPHDRTDDICHAAKALGSAAYDEVTALCSVRSRQLNASTAMWITTGVLAVSTAVFVALLASHRRHPLASELARRRLSFGGGWMRGGVQLRLEGRF